MTTTTMMMMITAFPCTDYLAGFRGEGLEKNGQKAGQEADRKGNRMDMLWA